MHSASASCPSALSFIFKPCPNDDPVKAGSVGVGCTIDRNVTVTVSIVGSRSSRPRRFGSQTASLDGKTYLCRQTPPLRNAIVFNGSPISFPTVEYVVKTLTDQPLEISITSPLPLGYGFGISGASALATAYALNHLRIVETQNPTSLQQLAHTAEIINKTGLGTVGTQISGGFLVKEQPGLPVSAQRLPFTEQSLYITILDKLETPAILSDTTLLQRVNHAADRALTVIKGLSSPRLHEILDVSYDFIRQSGLPIHGATKKSIEDIRAAGGHATMAILGHVVISTQPPSLPQGRIEKVTITANKINDGKPETLQ